MPLPKPEPGLVFGYRYLWAREADCGVTDDLKDRPCAIVLTKELVNAQLIVTAVPITHTPPENPDLALEIPPRVKAHLGLDDAPSWIILSEYNAFIWPGPDLAPVSRDHPDRFDYGFLPPRLFTDMKNRLINGLVNKLVDQVERDA